MDLDNCNCNERYKDFVYPPHGHVHTGNLNVVENLELRSIMKFGAKYREQCYIKPDTIFSSVDNSLDEFIKSFAVRCKTDVKHFKSWKELIMKKVQQKMTKLKFRKFSPKVLSNTFVKQYIKQLQERFVIGPVDKASNNFAIICKKFYLSTLCGELGIQSGEIFGNNVYKFMDGYTVETVIENHKK